MHSLALIAKSHSKPLKATEEELRTPDACPYCHESFQVSPEAQESIDRERKEKEDQLAEKQRLKVEEAAERQRLKVEAQRQRAEENTKERKLDEEARNVIVTTTTNVEGFRVIEYLGIDGIEFVVGTGVISELVTEVGDLFGGRSRIFESKLRQGREQALRLLQVLALRRNANAVIAIDFDYSPFSSNRTAIIVTGTFVKVVPAG